MLHLNRGPTRAKAVRWVVQSGNNRQQHRQCSQNNGLLLSTWIQLAVHSTCTNAVHALFISILYFSPTVGLNFQRLSGRCVRLCHSTTPLSNSTPLSLWCTCVEAAHPGLFRLFSIYSNITDNDPTYKTISTPARRMTWIKDALRTIFTPIMYLWQVERVADRYSRHRYQFQQVLAEISRHTLLLREEKCR